MNSTAAKLHEQASREKIFFAPSTQSVYREQLFSRYWMWLFVHPQFFFAQNQFFWLLFHQIFSLLCSSKSFHRRPILCCECACFDLYRFKLSKKMCIYGSICYIHQYIQIHTHSIVHTFFFSFIYFSRH